MEKNKIIATSVFHRRFKRFVKKFPSLGAKLEELEQQLLDNPETGTSLGAGLFKVRLASKSKGAGKSGGFRVITYLIREREDTTEIYLIVIYDKSEEGNIDKSDLLRIAKEITR